MFKDLKVGDKVYHINGRNDVVEEVIKKVGIKYIYIASDSAWCEDQKFLKSNGELVSRMYSKTISLDKDILDTKAERMRIHTQMQDFFYYDDYQGKQRYIDLQQLRIISKIIDKAEKIYAEKEGS